MKKIILDNIFVATLLVILINVAVYFYFIMHQGAPNFVGESPSKAHYAATFVNLAIVAVALLLNLYGFVFIKKDWLYKQFVLGIMVGGLASFLLLPLLEYFVAQKKESTWQVENANQNKIYDSLNQKNISGEQNFTKMNYIGIPSKSSTGRYHLGDTVCGGIVINVIDDTSNAVVLYPDFKINNSTADDAFTTVAQSILYSQLPLKGFWRLPRTDELQSIYNNPKLKKYYKNDVKNCWGIMDTYSIETGIFNFKNGQINFNPKPVETATTMLVYQF